MAVLPAKYSWEAMRHGDGQMSAWENNFVSTGMVLFCYILALTLPNLGTVIAVTGASVNPLIGFILPILFYLKIDPEPGLSLNKVVAKVALACVALVSIMGFAILF
mmetsp:Transcript_19655/g.26584  ORF Transcript_19655/g.26584 Transcript_19655/m.26584 type:complete len:106 (-) Transcript_19655:108-425(-)